jgi:hypothetical protein
MSENVRTVAVTVMRRHFLAYRNWLDHAESNVAPLAEQFAIVVAVMLSLFRGGKNGGQANVA